MEKRDFFKETLKVCLLTIFSVFALQNLDAQQICIDNSGDQKTGTIDGYDWELWNQNSAGTGCMELLGGAKFSCNWSGIENFLARSGLRYNQTQEHQEIGTFDASYNCIYNPNASSGNSYLSVYGWTIEPLVEYYVIEDWRNWIPSMAGNAVSMGTFNVDGGTYEIVQVERTGPSIIGNATFMQYFSIRQSTRTSGTISISEHFNKWESLGMDMGKMHEVSFVVEGYQNSGQAEFTQLDVTVSTGGQPVTGVSLNQTSASLNVGETVTLTPTVAPSNASNKNVTWGSSNTTVATVNSSGVVTAQGEGSATIAVTTVDGGFTATCSVQVSDEPTEQTAYPNGVPHAIPGNINATHYDVGGSGVAYNDSDAGNNGSGIRSNEDVDTENRATGGNVGWLASGEWLEYTVDVAQTGSYNIEVEVASTSSNGAYHIEFNGNDKTGVQNVSSTGDWGNFVIQTIENVDLSAGQQVMRIYMDGSSFNIGNINIESNNGCDPTAITPFVQINSGALTQTSQASTQSGDNVLLSPQAASGGSWSWSGPNGFSATTREITLSNIQTSGEGQYAVTYTNSCGTQSSESFSVTVGSTTMYTVSLDASGCGSANMSPNGTQFAAETNLDLTATEGADCSFTGWQINGAVVSTALQTSVTVNGNMEIIALFESSGNPCDNPSPISLSFVQNGTGQYCWVTSDDISYINSWNLESLEINGVDFTNTWANNMPPKIDGNYYISYNGQFGWSHFEANGVNKSGKVESSKQVKDLVGLSVYPNPLRSEELVVLGDESMKNSTMRILDVSGKQVFAIKLTSTKTIIPRDNFKKGLYLIEITNRSECKTLKLIVE